MLVIAFVVFAGTDAECQERGRIFPYQWPSGVPQDEITTADVQHALAWTGYYAGMADGGYGPYTRRAVQDWLAARGFPKSDTLTGPQAAQLVSEGLKRRDQFGWADLVDDAVGFSVGIPTALSQLQRPERNNGMLQYFGKGRVAVTISVQPALDGCAAMDEAYDAVLNLKENRPDYKARKDDWFVVAGDAPYGHFYVRAQCRKQGIVGAVMKMANGEDLSFLYVAFSNSLSLRPVLYPFAVPAPRIVRPALQSMAAVAASPPPPLAQDTSIDRSGKTASLSLVLSNGKELRAQDVFAHASQAVYVVDAGERQGSAVAISERELLTNCHVVQGNLSVGLLHEGTKQVAYVVSANKAADRCILAVMHPLPVWVKIRPYADVKVGEHVYTIGSPKGLELTLAEGLVSSKRAIEGGSRFIQTSAPISPGSSGGGLFDAQGNLIGITTFMLRDSQNLNFAIAAEEYGK
jgi:peptidoglycan hydrolase-like protein with peptidoglycan-binding domain